MGILGNRIKKERENLKLTREELAKKIGVSYSAIAMYEQGNREPSNELLLKMCEIFNCSMDYLMGKSSYRNKREEIDAYLNKMDFIDIDNAVQHYYNKFLEIGFNKEDIEDFKSTLNFDRRTSFEENSNKLDMYLNKFPLKKRKEVRDLMMIILGELSYTEKYRKSFAKLFPKENSEMFYSRYSKFYMCPVYGQISAGQPNWAEECIEGRLPIDPNMMNIVDPEECFFLRVNGESMNKLVRNGAYALIRKTDWVENGEIAVVLVNGFDATLKKFSKQGDLVVLEPMSNDSSFQVQIYDKNTPIKILGKYIGKFEMK